MAAILSCLYVVGYTVYRVVLFFRNRLIRRSVEESIDFYQNVPGFILSEGQVPSILMGRGNFSCPCESMGAVEKKLKEMAGIAYVRTMMEEGGIHVDQIFFHDPDGFMVEICNCDNLPVVPFAGEMARSCSQVNLRMMQQQQQKIRVVNQ